MYLAEEYSFFIFFVDFLFIILSLIVELYILDHHALEVDVSVFFYVVERHISCNFDIPK